LQNQLELLASRMTIFGNARASTEAAEYLAAIRARIRRSLDDPRPDMALAEVDSHLAALFARAAQTCNGNLIRSSWPFNPGARSSAEIKNFATSPAR
jgi:hypothetical protein